MGHGLKGHDMGDSVTLSDGRVLEVDLHKITMREYRRFFTSDSSPYEDDEVFAKALGLTADELVDLPQPDYRAACFAVLEIARKPLAVPNSASASTLD